MVNPWFPFDSDSGSSPLAPGESSHPSPEPPDPDDPYPPLSSASPKPTRASLKLAKSSWPVSKSPLPLSSTDAVTPPSGTVSKLTVDSGSVHPRSGKTIPCHQGNFKILQPKYSSPIKTNLASSSPVNHSSPPINLSPANSVLFPNSRPVSPLKNHQLPSEPPPLNPFPSPPLAPSVGPVPLVEKIRKLENKVLRRLAPVTLTDKGVPRVLIPDSVFEKGAEIHKNFIICYFNGRPPPNNQVQSVLSHMWGKGKRVEFHPNPLSRSMLVRIPSDYLRQKILEKGVWYVGDSMFHAVQWSPSASVSPPPLVSIQIWAHLTGVPLDLRHEEGLSLVAGLVGEPKETDDFTKNLVSLTLSHVKVAVDLSKPLPSIVEFMRQSGEVVEVHVSYPWVPPTCSHCKELGHVSRNCLQLPLPSKSSDLPAKKNQKSAPATAKEKNKGPIQTKPIPSVNPADLASSSSSGPSLVPSDPSPAPLPKTPTPPCVLPASPLKKSLAPTPPPLNLPLILSPKPPFTSFPPPLCPIYSSSPLSPPDSYFAPSLKRPRPDPSSPQFQSFSAQLSFVTSSSHPPPQSLALSPHDLPLSNHFSSLAPCGSLHHEETID